MGIGVLPILASLMWDSRLLGSPAKSLILHAHGLEKSESNKTNPAIRFQLLGHYYMVVGQKFSSQKYELS